MNHSSLTLYHLLIHCSCTTTTSGAEIHVEERPSAELTSIFDIKIAPDGINAWNPSFDVTPCSLIKVNHRHHHRRHTH